MLTRAVGLSVEGRFDSSKPWKKIGDQLMSVATFSVDSLQTGSMVLKLDNSSGRWSRIPT